MSTEAQRRANKKYDEKRRKMPRVNVRLNNDDEADILKKLVGKHGGSIHDAVLDAFKYYIRYK